MFRDGPSLSFALDLAKSQINNQTEILPDYRIELLHDDSGCEFMNKATMAFVRSVYYNRQKIIGIIGPGCSDGTLVLAPLTNNENISLVNVHSAGTPLLSNRTLYKYALGSLGSTEGFVKLAMSLLQRNNWTRVGLLFDSDSSFFVSTAQLLKERVKVCSNLTIGYFSPVLDIPLTLTSIFELGVRVNFFFTPTETTKEILCLAYHRGMVYDFYQWVTYESLAGFQKNVSFSVDGIDYFCSQDDMKRAIEGAIFFY